MGKMEKSMEKNLNPLGQNVKMWKCVMKWRARLTQLYFTWTPFLIYNQKLMAESQLIGVIEEN